MNKLKEIEGAGASGKGEREGERERWASER